MAYALWLPTLLVISSWVTDLTGDQPDGVLARVVGSALAGLPGWVGAALAVLALRAGGRAASWVALVLCLGTALVLLVGGVLSPP